MARLRLALLTATACLAAALGGVMLAQRDSGDAASGSAPHGALRPPGARAPAFAALRDQDGRPAELPERGIAVVTFVYSVCRDVCPGQVQAIRGALDALGRDVPVYAVSVDPGRDTPASARAFLLAQHVRGRMRFLLGSRAALAPVWRAYGIAPQRGGLDHSAYTILVRDRRQRIGFPASQLTAEGLAADLGGLARWSDPR